MPDEVTLTIDSIAAGGAGVGRAEGMAVFVPRTAPGDNVRVNLRRRRRYAEGAVIDLLSAGADRVDPPCPHYVDDRCGGCQVQHLSYEAQLTAKRDIVTQAIRRIARREVEVSAVHPAPAPWRYRNKLTLTVRRTSDGWIGGLRPYDAPDKVFALGTCLIADASIERAWHEVNAVGHLLPLASELRLVFRAEERGTALIVVGGGSWTQRDALRAACPALSRIRHDPVDAPGVIDDESASLGAFAQVNPSMAATMFEVVLAHARAGEPRQVVDAFGGRGELAERLAQDGAEVTLIELDREATRIATARATPGVTVVTARVEDVIARSLPADLVVLNPPRSGVDPAVCSALERDNRTPRLIYVSCDPATLARDISRLPSWRLDEVTPFDMFPQTAHVETVCILTREGR